MCKRPEVGGPSESQRLEGRVPGQAEEFGLSSKGAGEPWKVIRQGWQGQICLENLPLDAKRRWKG